MTDLIEVVCIPEWIKYLSNKNASQKKGNFVPRKDALWKRVLRDIRDFFRILFRNRFYSYNYRNKKCQTDWVRIFLEELGLPLPLNSSEFKHIFTFIHQTHRIKNDGKPLNRYDEIYENPFCAIDCYNTKTRLRLISHPISSRMIYMVVKNYSHVFESAIWESFKKEYMQCVEALKTIELWKQQ